MVRKKANYDREKSSSDLVHFKEVKDYHGLIEVRYIDPPIGGLTSHAAKVSHLYKSNPKSSESDIITNHGIPDVFGKSHGEVVDKINKSIQEWAEKN